MEYLKVKKNACCLGGEIVEYYECPSDGWLKLVLNLVSVYGGDDRGAYYLTDASEAEDLYPEHGYNGPFPAYCVYDHSEIKIIDAKNEEAILSAALSMGWGDWCARLVDEELSDEEKFAAEMRSWNMTR